MCISNEQKKKLEEFQKKYNLEFSDIKLLNQAFVHTSYTNEHSLDALQSYERLEFFGDAVLKLCISEFLFNKYPESKEGELTELRAQIVSDRYIFNFAKKLDFESLIVVSTSEKAQGGNKKESILACAFEALLGAIFINYKEQGYKKAYEFLIDNFKEEILDIKNKIAFLNPKAKLQEYTQSINKSLPVYETVEENGKAHDRTFYVEVSFNNKIIGKGSAKSIKQAQQEAANDALKGLGIL